MVERQEERLPSVVDEHVLDDVRLDVFEDAVSPGERNADGLEKRLEAPMGDNPPWIEVAPKGAETTIALFPPREGDPTGIETHVAFDTDDIDALHAYLKDQGVDVDDEISRMGDPVPPMFFFRDPDGNRSFVVERS